MNWKEIQAIASIRTDEAWRIDSTHPEFEARDQLFLWAMWNHFERIAAVVDAAIKLNAQSIADTGKCLSYELRDALKALGK